MITANHRCLDLQYMLDSSEARRSDVAKLIGSMTHVIVCPECAAFIELVELIDLKADVIEYDISDHIPDATEMVKLTEEQKAAIHIADEYLPDTREFVAYHSILRGILTQSTAAWTITEERKAAILRIIVPVECLMVDDDIDPELETAIEVLREMVEEVEKE